MNAITCRVCGRAIRGNAAAEEYDEVQQVMRYTCAACGKLFARATAPKRAEGITVSTRQ